MENEPTMDVAEPSGNFVAKSSGNEGQHISHCEILNRRLKNRERQRRYRARKRLEADAKKASNADPSTEEHMLSQHERNNSSCVTRVSRRRNWKEDARRAHSCYTVDEKLETAGAVASSWKYQSSSTALKMEAMKNNFENSDGVRSYDAHSNNVSQRNWKAEARNMKR